MNMEPILRDLLEEIESKSLYTTLNATSEILGIDISTVKEAFRKNNRLTRYGLIDRTYSSSNLEDYLR